MSEVAVKMRVPGDFTTDLRAILEAEGQSGLGHVAEKLEALLANPAFVAETFDDSIPPGKRVLWHDAETDAYVLAKGARVIFDSHVNHKLAGQRLSI